MPDADLALATLVAAGGPLAPRRALLDAAGDARSALRDPALWTACGLGGAQIAALRRPDASMLQATAHWLSTPSHRLLACTHPDYPPALRNAASPPLALCVAGDPALLWRPAIAVVGSRGPTPAGREHAAEFARAFVGAGFVVG
ncbi:MAG TPA: DNA-processing protein DprA, partial [Lysobacter sp.]